MFKINKNEWTYLYNNNPYLTIFQEYDFFARAIKYYWYYFVFSKCYIAYYLIKDKNKPVLIAPILHYINGKKELFANQNGYNYSNFIYTPCNLEKVIKFLKSKIGSIEAHETINPLTINTLSLHGGPTLL